MQADPNPSLQDSALPFPGPHRAQDLVGWGLHTPGPRTGRVHGLRIPEGSVGGCFLLSGPSFSSPPSPPPSPSSAAEGLKHSGPWLLCPKDSFRLNDPVKLCVSRHFLPQGLGNATLRQCGHGGKTGLRGEVVGRPLGGGRQLRPQLCSRGAAGCLGPGCLKEVLAANWILHLRPQVRGLGPSGAGRAARVSAQPSSAGQAGGGLQRGGT